MKNSNIDHLDLMVGIDVGFIALLLIVLSIKGTLEILCNRFKICYNN